MDEILLVASDFQPFRFLSVNMDFSTISPYILEAQRNDLVELMGQAMYYRFWREMSPPDPVQPLTIWSDLLNGVEYTPEGSTDALQFYGVKPYLVYRTFARFLNKSQVKMTRAGAVSKRTDESEYIDKDTLDKLRAETDSFGELYKQNIISFLNAQSLYYPLWTNTGCISRSGRKGLRVRSVSSRYDYYLPYAGGCCCGLGESAVVINNIYSGGSGEVV